ncbi:ABC transporter ATP-binding protein [Moraxella sp. ZY210820]|uniref:ABC transporter ATP-binding protein n=1 Tax=unclassified Moraxella TaxID=2685852 RepID=UPI0027312C33|nr:ABC transporter ATP-binding protein [Moraxella sp. ZY210820]WLF84265.1 ABC transporter ATP-binding protein [Moraxella sp. ZY210820]
MIEIQQLSFYYGEQQILFDININLHENSITGLIGPNGAGKSTLMRCIAGLEIPRQGQVLLNGEPILANPQHSYTQLGYLPDIFGLSEQLTILQYWTYSAHAKGVASEKIPEAVAQTAQLLNLEHKLHHRIRELSRGQRQRVGIGQVIIHQPKLLILDEPASGLDPEARHELSQLFNRLKAQGMTLLVSSHILSELDEYCTHILVLKQGKIVKHQAINHENSQFIYTGQQSIPLVLRFAQWNDEIYNTLKQAPHLSHLQFDEKQMSVIASISPETQKRIEIIQYCVEKQLPLIGVEILKESLLHTYQKTLHHDETGA